MKKPLDVIWMTPGKRKDGKQRDFVVLFMDGEWNEIYKGEAILVHRSRKKEFENKYLTECEGPFIYKTPESAEKGGKGISGRTSCL